MLNIEASTAQLTQQLNQTKGLFGGLQNSIGQVKNVIAGAFAVGSIVAATTKLFEFSQEIGNLTNQMKSLSGLVGNDLVEATAKAKAISDTFNVPYEKLLEGARAISKEFGVSIPDALEKIKQGYALTGSEEFLDILREYPGQFASAGASADDFFKIATQQINEGVYSDKGVDAVKEFSLRIRELTPATNDALTAIGLSGKQIQQEIANGTLTSFGALQKVSQQLRNFKDDSQQVGMVLADVFGGPGEDAGIRYIKMLGDTNLQFKDLVATADDGVKAQLHLADANEKLDKVWVQLFGNAKTTSNEFKAQLTDIAVDALQKIRKGIVDISNFLIDTYNNSILFRSAIISLVTWWKTLFEAAKLVFNLIIDQFKTFGQLIKAVLTGNFKDIPSIIKQSFDERINDIKVAGENTAQAWKEGFEKVTSKEKIKLIDDAGVQSQATTAARIFKETFNGQAVGKSIKITMPEEPYEAPVFGSTPGEVIDQTVKAEKMVKITLEQAQATKAATSAWSNFGQIIEKNVGGLAVNAVDSLGSSLAEMVTGQESGFKSLVNSILGGIRQIINALLAQSIASQVASNSKFGLPGLIAAGIGIAAVQALFASIPKFESGGIVGNSPLQLIGERGPELISAPAGSRIYSNSETNRLLNSSSSINIKIESITRGEDIHYVVKEIERKRGNTR